MTAGANDANGAHSSLHTLESTGVLVTEDTHDGASDEAVLICHGKCAVCVTEVASIFILPSNHVVLLVPECLLGQCILGVPRNTQTIFFLNSGYVMVHKGT